ncbi:MAG: hypothetical protein DRQ47_08210, partial [Gammaproteobacteria bacterium]
NYIVITANTHKELEDMVKEQLVMGWDLGQFSAYASHDEHVGHYTVYCQTMTKSRPEKREYTGPR